MLCSFDESEVFQTRRNKGTLSFGIMKDDRNEKEIEEKEDIS